MDPRRHQSQKTQMDDFMALGQKTQMGDFMASGYVMKCLISIKIQIQNPFTISAYFPLRSMSLSFVFLFPLLVPFS